MSEAAMEAGSIMARRKRSELVTVSAMPWLGWGLGFRGRVYGSGLGFRERRRVRVRVRVRVRGRVLTWMRMLLMNST